MINAVISGQARTALLIDGEKFSSFDIDAPEVLKPRRESDLRYLFGAATDLRFIQNTRREEVLLELRTDYDKTCALDLALMLLDEDIQETKPQLGEALEELLTETDLTGYLDSIFYAAPLPESADMENALSICHRAFPKTYKWLSILVEKQADIAWVKEVWENIEIDVFGNSENRVEFQKVFVQEGIFRELVLDYSDNKKINSLNLSAAMNQSITSLPNHRAVLQDLFAPFKQSSIAKEDIRLLKDEKKENVRPRERRKVRIDREAVKNSVQSQIDYITTHLKNHDLASAQKLTRELIVYQQRKSEPIHLVKSLCQIAQNAKELEFYKLQLDLTEKAIRLQYSDAWAQIQYGDALLRNHRYKESLETYEIAISFSVGKSLLTEVLAKRGYAEVSKAQGNLDEALRIYREVMTVHPEDVTARNGYAEVLKAQGKFSEALQVYKETMELDPEDITAKNGYAEVLKAQGKFTEIPSSQLKKITIPSILQRIAQGDKVAIQNLLDTYGGLIWSLARRMIQTSDEVEDLVQEIFIEIWKKANQFDETASSETTFIAMIARRQIINNLTNSKSKSLIEPVNEKSESIFKMKQSFESSAKAREETKKLKELRAKQEEVLKLSIIHGFSNKKIANILNISLRDVKTHAPNRIIKAMK